jgi:hypothetical protein
VKRCRLATLVAFHAALLLGSAAPVGAADQVVTGSKLVLKRSAARETLILVLKHAGMLVPPPGDADDPVTAGMRIQLFGHDPSETAELVVPPGAGAPGWSEHAGARTRYRYRNRDAPADPSPVRLVVLREGRGLKVVARRAGLALTDPQGSVGIRIEMGSTRICALFAGSAVRRDRPGRFVARKAAEPGLTECTDEGLFGLGCEESFGCGGLCPGGAQCGGAPGLGCECVSPDQPCGDTDPVCNGQCPEGWTCADVGGVPYPSCACLATGSTGCGTVYPTCGDGDCPSGTTCYTDTFRCCGDVTITGCACLSGPPPLPCGGTCPSGWTCVQQPGAGEFCLPPFCGGGSQYPICGGTCETGTSCLALSPFCLCLSQCDGGEPYPTCGGTCSQARTTCRAEAITGRCLCLP